MVVYLDLGTGHGGNTIAPVNMDRYLSHAKKPHRYLCCLACLDHPSHLAYFPRNGIFHHDLEFAGVDQRQPVLALVVRYHRLFLYTFRPLETAHPWIAYDLVSPELDYHIGANGSDTIWLIHSSFYLCRWLKLHLHI